MCRVLALSSHSNIKEIEEFLPQKVELEKGSFNNVEIFIDNKVKILHKNENLTNFQFIWLNSVWKTRAIAFATMKFLESKNIPHTKTEKSVSKLTDSVIYGLNKVNQPRTYFCFNIKQNLEKVIKYANEFVKYPLIIKDVKGSLGKNIFLINNEKELIETSKLLKNKKQYIIQEFIPNDFDWGVNIGNGKVVVASKRIRQNHPFLNNAYQGAKEIFFEPDEIPDNVKEEAIKAAKFLKLDWGRADIVVSKVNQKPYVLEFNRRPGMTEDSLEVQAFANFLESKIERFNLI